MKRKLPVLILLLATLGNSLFAQYETRLSNELFISKLNDKLFVVTHYFPWESNSLILKALENEVVLIDTPYENSATTLMLQWIYENLKPAKIIVINTGFHVDNLGGNLYLREKGIDIYGSERTCQLIEERGEKTRQQLISWLKPGQESIKNTYENLTFVKPNLIFKIEEGLALIVGNFTLDLFFPGETHSADNIAVYIRELNFLFGGCMIKSLSNLDLGFTADANLSEWPNALIKLQEK